MTETDGDEPNTGTGGDEPKSGKRGNPHARASAAAKPPSSREELLWQLTDAVRANQRATHVLDEVAGQILGVNRTDGRCLDILDQHGRMTAGELARESGLTTGAITAVIDRLERIGYVQRIADPNDRRRVLVDLTVRARDASIELFGPLADAAEPYLARYTDAELKLLIEFQRVSREVQERHAADLRERVQSRRKAAGVEAAGDPSGPGEDGSGGGGSGGAGPADAA